MCFFSKIKFSHFQIKKMINNFHYVFFFQKLNLSIIESKLNVLFKESYLLGS